MHKLFTLLDFLENAALLPVFNNNGMEISGSKFIRDIEKLSAKINATDLSHWALCYQDSYLFAVAFFAVILSERIPVLLPNNKSGTFDALQHEFTGVLTDIAEIKATTLSTEITIDKNNKKTLRPEQQLIMFTSGSTGDAKKQVKQLAQLMAEVEALEQTFGEMLASAPVYTSVSHQHIYGLLFVILWPLCANRTIYLPALRYPEEIAAKVNTKEQVVLITSPALLVRMEANALNPKNLIMFSSGGVLNPDAAASFAALDNLIAIDMFGSTETGGVGFRRFGALNWKPLPQVELSLVPDSGCLKVQSPFFTSESGFVMGDSAVINQDGSFTLLGRVDRIAKIEGKRVSLQDIEHKLERHELVQDAYVLALETNRQYIAAAIVLNTDGWNFLAEHNKQILNTKLKHYLADYFDGVLLPRQWRYVQAIPINQQGKYVVKDVKKLFSRDFISEPQILNKDVLEKEITLELFIPETLEFFKGHFPEVAILPGVVQLNWVMQFAKEYLELDPADLAHIEQLKFTKVIKPNSTVLLELKFINARLEFRYYQGDVRYSFGKIRKRM